MAVNKKRIIIGIIVGIFLIAISSIISIIITKKIMSKENTATNDNKEIVDVSKNETNNNDEEEKDLNNVEEEKKNTSNDTNSNSKKEEKNNDNTTFSNNQNSNNNIQQDNSNSSQSNSISQQENIILKLNGGWKTKDNSCQLTTISGIEFTFSCYLYINNDYGYKSSEKENFTILDNSHFKIGDLVKYFYFQSNNSLIVGSTEYVRINNLVEEDFNCIGDYECPIYDKMDRQVLSSTTD